MQRDPWGPSRKQQPPRLIRPAAQATKAAPGEFDMGSLAMLSLGPLLRQLRRWWMARMERHYLMCADVEQQRAQEAHQNVAYYQKQAVLARSAQR